MPKPKIFDAANELLSLPQVLWAAWQRIDRWYRSGNLAPQPELSIWRLNPEAQIRKLAAEVRNGIWTPSPWQQIPYPKKGAFLRHYSMPTVKDQVAFMAHLVLLGPLLDRQFHNFALGNRWYRPIVWDHRMEHGCWRLLPYPFLTDKTYLPYARSHGLYRRVANWTVKRMTGAKIASADFVGPVQIPSDYPNESLPPWTRNDWWGQSNEQSRLTAYWATMDLQLAYPSVKLSHLREILMNILENDEESLSSILSGFPSVICNRLLERKVRQQIACALISALQKVQYGTDIPLTAWRPPHLTQKLPPANTGLPTGLQISGLLMNVVLHESDGQILKWLISRTARNRGAFIRFADDMIVMSRSIKGLFDLIDEVWRSTARNDSAVLAVPQSDSNLRLNVSKFGPPEIRKVVERYLIDYGWKKCEECEQIYQSGISSNPTTLSKWWKSQSRRKDHEVYSVLLDSVNRAAVGPSEVGPFVTTLVERLSEIGHDTLAERFGEGARDRLVRLHELARLDVHDEQVRPDTRRSFAANRLVKGVASN